MTVLDRTRLTGRLLFLLLRRQKRFKALLDSNASRFRRAAERAPWPGAGGFLNSTSDFNFKSRFAASFAG
tara:strand:+ start:1079 stop:1288 length:210 start_codon:yes stop_codon:yes gene_type:complete